MEKTGKLFAKVLSADGFPIPDVPVLIKSNKHHHLDIAILSDDKGNFNFYDLPFGEYTLELNDEHIGQKKYKVNIDKEESYLQIKME